VIHITISIVTFITIIITITGSATPSHTSQDATTDYIHIIIAITSPPSSPTFCITPQATIHHHLTHHHSNFKWTFICK
jgi:hypothetical protein